MHLNVFTGEVLHRDKQLLKKYNSIIEKDKRSESTAFYQLKHQISIDKFYYIMIPLMDFFIL